MRIERHLYNAYCAKLKEFGESLSDRCKSYIKQQDNYTNIKCFLYIALNYDSMIVDRFFSEEEDEEDSAILQYMIVTIDTIYDLIELFED